MTVTTTTPKVNYTGDGVTTAFPVTFTFYADSDLEVIERIIATGAETAKTLTTDYTVTGGSGSTGTVNAVAAPASTVEWHILRTVPKSQAIDFPVAGPLPSGLIEEMGDRAIMGLQQLQEIIDRSVKFPTTDDSSLDTEIPSSVERASKLLGFDVSGNVSAETNPSVDAELTAIAAITGIGMLGRTADDTWAVRTITGTINEVTITNGNGISGNPTISLPSALKFTGKTVTDGTFNSALVTSTDSTTARTLAARFGEIYNVVDYGAPGDGSASQNVGIQLAIDAAVAAGGGTVLFPAGIYSLSDTLVVAPGQHNVRLFGEGPDISILLKENGIDFEMLTVGSSTTSLVTTEGNTLAANATTGDQTITVVAGKGANFAAGEDVIIFHDTLISAAKGTQVAEMVNIFSVSTDTLTLSRPLRNSYATAANAEVQRVNWVDGFETAGLSFDGNSYATGGGNVNLNNLIEIYWARAPQFRAVLLKEGINYGLGLGGCIDTVIDGFSVLDLLSNGIQGNVGSYGYGVVELGLNEGLRATNILGDRVRHVYTTATSGMAYGEPFGSVISNSIAKNCRGSGWDTHPGGRDITFANCHVLGSLGGGLQARATNTRWDNCMVRDCIGAALDISADATNTRVRNFRFVKTNLGTWDSIDWTLRDPIYDLGTNTKFDINTGIGDVIPGGDNDDTFSDGTLDIGSTTRRWKDFYLGGSIYIGGTGAANALNDYEEGTFTPVFADASSGGNVATGTGITGRYTKIGNMVHVYIEVSNIDTTGLTALNDFFIQALPFTIKSGNITSAALRHGQITYVGQLIITGDGGTTYLRILDQQSGAAQAYITVGGLNSGAADVFITMTYEVD